MEKEPLLMLPGPVPIPERVRMAMLRQAINHRGAEFGSVYADCVRVLKKTFATKNDLFVISGSGYCRHGSSGGKLRKRIDHRLP